MEAVICNEKQYICPKCDSRRVTIDELEKIENGKKVYDPIWICEGCDHIGIIDLGDIPKGWQGSPSNRGVFN